MASAIHVKCQNLAPELLIFVVSLFAARQWRVRM